MIKIHRTLFCQQISQGLFGKLNFEGYIPLNKVKLSNVPYVLETHLVAEVEAYDKNLHGKSISICFKFQSFEGHTLFELLQDCGPLPEINVEIPLLCLPIHLEIPDYGVLRISFLVGDELIFEDFCTIEQGESANFRLTDRIIPSSEIISKTSSDFSLAPLLSKSLREIVIIDLYLTSNFLLNEVIPLIPKEVKVKILTGENLRSKYIQDRLKIEAHSNKIEVRFSRDRTNKRGFHDRFVINDWIECFQFGHSLKDLLNDKISRRSKISSQEEIEALKTLFDVEWDNAELF